MGFLVLHYPKCQQEMQLAVLYIVKILGASPEAFDIRLYELETKQASGN